MRCHHRHGSPVLVWLVSGSKGEERKWIAAACGTTGALAKRFAVYRYHVPNGRTQGINFFEVNRPCVVLNLPGYGQLVAACANASSYSLRNTRAGLARDARQAGTVIAKAQSPMSATVLTVGVTTSAGAIP